MYIIAGLGNPGLKYAKTRHNMGFDCIDILAESLNIRFEKTKFNALAAKGFIGGEQVLLVKPLTYMNLSGNAVSAFVNYYKADPETNLIVIYDDTDLDIGRLRIRKKGSAGSHNGMKSIIESLGGKQEFIRIRVGIGKRLDYMEMVDFVLGRFDKEERKLVDESLKKAAQCVQTIVKDGIDRAMNMYNG